MIPLGWWPFSACGRVYHRRVHLGQWPNWQGTGLQNRRFQVRALAAPFIATYYPPVAITPYVIFFLAGLAFGYAAPGRSKWIPLLFPVVLFLIALFQEGASGTTVIRFIVALVITAVGVLLGILLERRADESSRAQYA